MKRRHTLAAAVVLTIVVALATVAWAQGGGFGGPPPGGPPPGGGGGGGKGMDMQAMTYLEKTWTAVTFQLDCTAEQQATLKTTYATELQTRNDAITQAMAQRDKSAMKKALETCQTNLNAKLQEVLTDDQWAKLADLLKPPGPPAKH